MLLQNRRLRFNYISIDNNEIVFKDTKKITINEN